MGGRLVSCWPRWLALAAALMVLTAAPTLAQLTDPVGPGQSVSAPAPMCPAISSNCYMQALFTNQVLPGTPEEYAAVIDEEEKKWGPLVRSLDLKVD